MGDPSISSCGGLFLLAVAAALQSRSEAFEVLASLGVAKKSGATAKRSVCPDLQLYTVGERNEDHVYRLPGAMQQCESLPAILVNAVASGHLDLSPAVMCHGSVS
jgi:hypothetical protein